MGETTRQIIALVWGVVSGSVMLAIQVFTPQLTLRFIAWRQRRAAAKTAATAATPATGPIDPTTPTTAPSSSPQIPESFVQMSGSVAALTISFIFATVALFIWRATAPATLAWFGITEILWYFFWFFVYAIVKYGREKKQREE